MKRQSFKIAEGEEMKERSRRRMRGKRKRLRRRRKKVLKKRERANEKKEIVGAISRRQKWIQEERKMKSRMRNMHESKQEKRRTEKEGSRREGGRRMGMLNEQRKQEEMKVERRRKIRKTMQWETQRKWKILQKKR